MKKVLSLSIIIILALTVFTGCQGSSADNSNDKIISTSVVKGGGQFPECLVGFWQSDGKWAFKIEPDGRILKFRHSLGGTNVDLEDKVVYIEGPGEDTYFLLAVSNVDTGYEPETRILDIHVFVEKYIIKLPAGTLEGKIEDHFTGTISEDCTTWTVGWRNYGWLDGAAEPDKERIDAKPRKMIFTKVDFSELQK